MNLIAHNSNPYLTNYGQNDYFWIIFEIIRVSAILAVRWYLKKNSKFFFSKKWKKKNLVKFWRPIEKICLSTVNLDVLTLELDMKVQFAKLGQIEYTKKSTVCQ
jgi:hypothetical protein